MEPERNLCRACEPGPQDAPEADAGYEDHVLDGFARQAGMSRPDLDAVLRGPAARLAGADEAVCVRCKERPAVEDSEFCINCHLGLYRALGDAGKSLLSRMEVIEEETPAGTRTLISSLERKRRMTASSHIDPAGGAHLRW